ncbi:Tetratricopeptide-like helical domain-containing protein [Dioscorea alata]|uniref:Tetratricopeptide-like helical domain-containing protein n=1 Tax=Dioscorea alata TaxID=55571 RepID=A0ACB7USM1_DIOAL|nr:Tetratricopeptide-like helical domain-containing protein [Dioscorea alata]
MDDGAGELQCVGRLEVAKPKPAVGFLCGTLPVLTDAPAFHSALLVPSPLTIGAPRYQMLPAETDLNTLPFLSGIPEKVIPAATGASEGLQWESNPVNQNLSTKCEALAVSGLTEYGDELDVVAPADILKQIFKMPYSKAQLSIAVHRIGDTLILNTGPDVEEGDKVFRKQTSQSKGSDPSIFLNFAMHSVRAEACDCPPTHTSPAEKQSTSTILPGRVTPACSHVGEAQFFDGNNNGNQNQENCDKFFWGGKQSKHKSRRHNPIRKASHVGEKSRCPVQESDKFRRVGNNGFLRVLFWKFHNFRMLLGSDLLLLSNEKYVAVSLHLWDVSRQVTPLTWLEAWLDNVMASVPELAICYHQNGVVQGYELIKTDDIFLLKGISEDGTPAFHPQVVQQNGLSVLRFLQDNCKQDPGAYWLYKDAGDDVIQLFDLSVIPEGHSTDDHDKGCSSFQSLMHKGRRESLFSLGTLLYRVAHRLSLSKAPDNRAKCAKFFKKCLDFLREHDHLIVRAYAHEQFARLILKCYEELEITSESFLLESEVTVTDLEDESSEFSVGTFGSTVRDTEPFKTGEGKIATAGDSCIAKDVTVPAATETGDLVDSSSSYKAHDNLAMCPISSTSHPVVRTITDPISSRLAAIHHVSQAIKSLRWNRQLQNTKDDLIDGGLRSHERRANSSFCRCGDADCIEVSDIREWLPKSKMDSKMWKLVLLLGESYLSLGEAYKDDGQLHQALTAVELACLIYGSMPQHLEDAQFISSMVGSSSYQLNLKDCQVKANLVVDSDESLEFSSSEEGFTGQFSPTYLFWPKAWTLVGDVYVEYYRTRVKEIPVQVEQKTSGSGLHMSNEVVREVKRLKRKLGQYKKNCSTCYLLNCSCQSDRASSGSSASSSSGDVPSYHSRKQNRKSNSRNVSLSLLGNTKDSSRLCRVENINNIINNSDNSKYDNDDYNNIRDMGTFNKTYNLNKASAAGNYVHTDEGVDSMESIEVDGFTSDGKDASKVRHGGIFMFLEGPRTGDVEYNMLAAIDCYNGARKAMDRLPNVSVDSYPLLRKKGWVCNELGRYRLENRNLTSAEIAFADAIKAFKEVSDHTNIILIDCNLGHGRRALAEELVAKMDELKRHPFLQNAYEQAMKTAKLEYLESLRYYASAKTELTSVVDEIDPLLRNEVYTQLAHTYLRLGMLLAREGISQEGFESRSSDSLLNEGKSKERRKGDISAGDAFREALSTYESLGESRKQEAAFSHFQLACYHRDFCLKFLDLDQKQVTHLKSEVNLRQKAKWYASLAEKHWQKSKDYYGPKTHSIMYLNILLELSALSLSLSSSLHSNMMLEVALHHLLEGRQVVVENEGGTYDNDPEIQNKFLNQLRVLLKSMLAASISGSPGKAGNIAQTVVSSRTGDNQKLREMYRMALKSTDLSQLPSMHKLWLS